MLLFLTMELTTLWTDSDEQGSSMKFTGNDKGVRLAILVLVILFVAMGAGYCTKADAQEKSQEQGLSLGFGIAAAGSEPCFQSMLLMQAVGDHWAGYLATHGDGDGCRNHDVRANFGAGIIRTAEAGKWTLGFGPGFLEHGDLVIGDYDLSAANGWNYPIDEGPQLVAAILVRYRISARLSIDLLHNSTGGATSENRGLNVLTLSGRF